MINTFLQKQWQVLCCCWWSKNRVTAIIYIFTLFIFSNDAAELQITVFLQLTNFICSSVIISCQRRVLWRQQVPLWFLNTVSLVFFFFFSTWCPLEPDLFSFVLHRPGENRMTVPLSMCLCLKISPCRAWWKAPEHRALRLMQAADWTYLLGKQCTAVRTQVTWITTPPHKCRKWGSSVLHFFNDTLAGWLTSVGRDRVLTLNNETKFSIT
jgi:hypothetical protein